MLLVRREGTKFKSLKCIHDIYMKTRDFERTKLLHYEINCETVSDLNIFSFCPRVNVTFIEPVLNWSILHLQGAVMVMIVL